MTQTINTQKTQAKLSRALEVLLSGGAALDAPLALRLSLCRYFAHNRLVYGSLTLCVERRARRRVLQRM